MEKLSENELQYYNSLDVWTPIQAVAVINSIKPESLSFPLPEEIKLQLNVIYSAWEGQFYNGCHRLFTRGPLKNPEYLEMIPEFISLSDDGYGMYDREYDLLSLNVKAFKEWMVGKEIFPKLSIQCSCTSKASNPSNQEQGNNDALLTGKERQELGRLRLEKNTMDATVKAAIEVGRHIEKVASESHLLIKDKITDLVNGIDSTIPTTRIGLIWKTIPNELKNGQGRPPKA